MNNQCLPRHIAIIMDGNGRWAKNKNLPRIMGHREGVRSVRTIVEACNEKGIEVLTLWAFSTENWSRPKNEVQFLMDLVFHTLEKEIKELHENNVQLRFIGDIPQLNSRLQEKIQQAINLTAKNTGLKLVIAFNYGGYWDITQATQKIAAKMEQGELHASDITSEHIKQNLSTYDLPDPDLLIRTSGEIRISNFMLWQLAYTELYFSDVLWPDFKQKELDQALEVYAARERRFGNINIINN